MNTPDTTPDTTKLVAALVEAQAAMKPPVLDATNPHFRSKYVTLAGMREAIVPPLAKAGIFLSTPVVDCDERGAHLACLVMGHGATMELGSIVVPVDAQKAQAMGSAITYGQRYLLASCFAIAGVVDDDGNDAEINPPKAKSAPQRPQAGPDGKVDYPLRNPAKKAATPKAEQVPDLVRTFVKGGVEGNSIAAFNDALVALQKENLEDAPKANAWAYIKHHAKSISVYWNAERNVFEYVAPKDVNEGEDDEIPMEHGEDGKPVASEDSAAFPVQSN